VRKRREPSLFPGSHGLPLLGVREPDVDGGGGEVPYLETYRNLIEGEE